ncbi:hypothetical protein F4814DRAFT_454094 [Daldinia grandis]|nr:hypothetical protein F4814DRAFT_454094 [Daldinia grandis]
MRLLQPLLYTSSLMLPTPAAGHTNPLPPRTKGADAITFTFQPEDGISGALTMHADQTLEYFRSELGIDVAKLRKHPELFDKSPGGHYTFPEASGVEGTFSWNLTGRDPASLIAYEQLTCDDCAAICAGLAVVPFGFIVCCSSSKLTSSLKPYASAQCNARDGHDIGAKVYTFQSIINGDM